MEISSFKLTDRETGEDITMTLVGYATLASKVYAICSYDDNAVGNADENLTAIFRIRYTKDKKPEFILVEDIDFCQKVMDAFYDQELKN